MPPTVAEVESLSSTGWSSLETSKKEDLLDMAERQANDLHSGRVGTNAIIDGDKDDFIKLLAAHMYEIAEGGEAQSESSTGGSVNYNTVTGEIPNGLSETRYGRQALEYIRDDSGIGFVTT